MKVFTVGLDQKPSRDDDSVSTVTEKNGPPPSYISTSPVPASYQQPAIIVQRKSRGYKGVLLVMLTVFLIALFALTISEIAYNRQRDENFFKLRWAELKHRMNNDAAAGPLSFFHRNFFNAQPSEDPQPVAQKIEGNQIKQFNVPSLSLNQELQTSTPMKFLPNSGITSTESSSNSNSNSIEVEQPNALLNNNEGAVRSDARLNFLRRILQKIKKHAEQMGFDGTMQISVIEVEPQADNAEISGNSIERSLLQRIPSSMQSPQFFSNPFSGGNIHSQQQQWNENNRFSGFGESPMQPLFMQNEIEAPRPRPFSLVPPPMMPAPMENGANWQRIEFPRPAMIQPQPVELPQALSRPFWNNDFYRQQQPQQVFTNQRQQDSERGEAYGRRFGDLLRDIIANRIQTFQHLTNPLVFEQQQKPQLQQQQQSAASQFQAVAIPKQDRPQPDWSRGGVINFQNDFFPPPSDQQTTDDSSKKVSDEAKNKEFVVSGEINNENAAGNQQNSQSESTTGEWLISKPISDQGKQEPEQVIPVKPIDSNPMMIPITGDIEEKENSKPKLDIADSWPAPIKIDGLKNVDESKEEQKNSDSTVQQPKLQQQDQNFPNSAPFFFQVDDPNQAQQQQPHIVT